jgi:hypothetical protein
VKRRSKSSPAKKPKSVHTINLKLDDQALEAIELVGKLIDRLGTKFAEQTKYLARYGDEVRRARGRPGYRPDIPGIAYFCEKALKLNEASRVLLEGLSNKLKASTKSARKLKSIARRPTAVPFAVDFDKSLKKIRWPKSVESVLAGGVEVYRKRARSSLKRQKQ